MPLRLQDCDFAPGDIVLHSAYWPNGKKVSLLGKWIASCGRGIFDHVGMLDYVDETWKVLEMVPNDGGREVPFFPQVSEAQGIIHWFRVPRRVSYAFTAKCKQSYINVLGYNYTHREYNHQLATSVMRGFVDTPYGYQQILRDFAWHLPLVRQCLKMPPDTEILDWSPVCSVAVSLALNAGFSWDLIPFLNDAFVEPSDIARCPFLMDMGPLYV